MTEGTVRAVRYEERDSIAILTLCRPEKLNTLTGAVPFYATRRLSRRLAIDERHPASSSTYQVLIGAAAFPLVWGPLVAAVWVLSSPASTAVFAASLVPSGLFAWFYPRRARKLAVHVGGRLSSWLKLNAVERVRDARTELLELMDGARERYLNEVFDPPGTQSRLSRSS